MQRQLGHIENWVFDLDNTLYPARCNLHNMMSSRISEYVARALSLPLDKAREVQRDYFLRYGTTLSGLMAQHGTDPCDYLDYVHGFALDSLKDAPSLRDKLNQLPGRKIIFTNADAPYAQRVLSTLGLEDVFEDIIDIHRISYQPKPDAHAYKTLLTETGIDPAQSIFFEDQSRNLAPAKAMGMATVWIDGKIGFGAPTAHDDHIDYQTDDLADWLQAAIDALKISI